MHSTAATAGKYSGSRKRCISSLQVTYHQEIHRPAPRLAHQPLYNHPLNSGSAEQRLEEDEHSQEAAGRLVPDHEELDFYTPSLLPPPPGTLPPLPPPNSSTQWEHKLQDAAGSCPTLPPPSQPPSIQTPHSPLFGLEDGLRQRVNVEIENFRASLQEVMRQQFASQRQSHHPHCSCHQYCQEENQHHPLDAMDELNEDETHQSVESSIDSGVCVEATPTEAPKATTPPPPGTEEEMSLALIRLQTLAAAITANLQQPEFTSH